MKKHFIALFALVAAVAGTSQVRAQEYNTAIGVNLGADMGVNLKHFISKSSAFEGIVAYNIPDKGFMVSVAYQYHIPLTTGLKFYAGGGVNIGGLHLARYENGKFAFGIDPNVGFEYKFANAPIALALDYKPNINFTCHSQWNLAAFKIRFTL